MSSLKVLIVANACAWASWPDKIAAIKAFYAPLVELDIDIKYTSFENIPTASYPGTVTEFTGSGYQDVQGTDLEIDQTWFNENIGPLISGYDIAVFQTTNVATPGLPLGIKFENLNGTWCAETFVQQETASYYLPGNGQSMGPDLGNEAEVIIEHEISHALYSISSQTDNTHPYFYSNQFSRILTDIKLPNQNTLIKLYQTLVADLQTELGILKQQQPTADPQTPQNTLQTPAGATQTPDTSKTAFPPKIIQWAAAITKEEGANPALHNPGNLKVSSLTESWGAIQGPAASDGGYLCQFTTEEAGMNALCNFLVLGAQNELAAFHSASARTLEGFTVIYAGNPPAGYINAIVAAMGVPADTQISTFLS